MATQGVQAPRAVEDQRRPRRPPAEPAQRVTRGGVGALHHGVGGQAGEPQPGARRDLRCGGHAPAGHAAEHVTQPARVALVGHHQRVDGRDLGEPLVGPWPGRRWPRRSSSTSAAGRSSSSSSALPSARGDHRGLAGQHGRAVGDPDADRPARTQRHGHHPVAAPCHRRRTGPRPRRRRRRPRSGCPGRPRRRLPRPPATGPRWPSPGRASSSVEPPPAASAPRARPAASWPAAHRSDEASSTAPIPTAIWRSKASAEQPPAMAPPARSTRWWSCPRRARRARRRRPR